MSIDQALQFLNSGRTEQGLLILKRLASKPNADARVLGVLGEILEQLGQPVQARFYLERAIKLAGPMPDLSTALARTLVVSGDLVGGLACYRRVLDAQPDHLAALVGAAEVLLTQGALADAVAFGRRAVGTRPDSEPACFVLGRALFDLGLIDELAALARDVREPRPDSELASSMLLRAMMHLPSTSPEAFCQEHRRRAAILARTLPADTVPPPARPPPAWDRVRPLRIGYVSQDFRNRSAAHFIEPFLACHDRARFRVHAYSSTGHVDETTARLKSCCDAWVETRSLSLRGLAERIRADQIDILVDLAGHTLGHRLDPFLHRAAPVQITYLGYPATTGLPMMDYRVVDAATDPPGFETHSSEKLLRLDPCFLCYAPPPHAPALNRPIDPHRPFTFASFNAFQKLSGETFDAWAEILRRASGTRLLIKNGSLASGDVAQRIGDEFSRRGIDPSRLELRPPTPTPAQHLETYFEADLALDSFPYTGTTTTMEALWMGVPVVTFPGRLHLARVSASLLAAAGLDEFVLPDVHAYIDAAVARAGPVRDATQRRALRDKVAASPVCQAEAFTRKWENLLIATFAEARPTEPPASAAP